MSRVLDKAGLRYGEYVGGEYTLSTVSKKGVVIFNNRGIGEFLSASLFLVHPPVEGSKMVQIDHSRTL